MRICIVYDGLYPWNVGGAERWYRGLAERLAERGCEVTYVTRRQWDRSDEPAIAGVRVVGVSPGGPLYTDDGRRRIGPPLRFGLGALVHLLRNRRSYDVVHCSSFPYFSLLAARLALASTGTRVFVDWLELWSAEYWRGYLGPIGGRVGEAVQRACVRATPAAFAISAHTGERLAAAGLPSEPIVLPGLYSGPREVEPALDPPARPLVMFAGRQIPEKRAHLVPAAVAKLRQRLSDARGLVIGDGPERPRVLAEIERLGLDGVVEAPGWLDGDALDEALRTATCLVLPSLREGYGLVVVESAAVGTPVLVTRGADTAAADLVVDGVNGYAVDNADPVSLATAIAAIHAGGAELRRSAAEWFRANADAISAEASAARVLEAYERALAD